MMYEMSETQEKKRKLAEFLTKAFWEWQAGDPKKTRIEWAEWINPNLDAATLGHWMNEARLPGKANVYRLAGRYPEVFEILGMEEEDLQYVIAAWHRMDKGAQRQIREQAERYLKDEGDGDVKGAIESTA